MFIEHICGATCISNAVFSSTRSVIFECPNLGTLGSHCSKENGDCDDGDEGDGDDGEGYVDEVDGDDGAFATGVVEQQQRCRSKSNMYTALPHL